MTASTDTTAGAAAPDMKTTAGKLADLRVRLTETEAPRGIDAIEETHAAGKSTARERILQLLDPDSFVEIDALARHRSTAFEMDRDRPATDGVVVGYGTISDRKVCVYSQDSTVFDGALGEVYGEKIVKIMDLAIKTGVPLISISDGSGVRVEEGIISLAMYSKIYSRTTIASGLIPQISLIMGTTSGAKSHASALTDFVVMVDKNAQLFVNTPAEIESATGTAVTREKLGGAHTHMVHSGTSHYTAVDEADALNWVRELIAHLPANNKAEAPRESADIMEGSIAQNITEKDQALDTLIPDSDRTPYDMVQVIKAIADDNEFFEIQKDYAPNILIGFVRVEGRSVGIVANQPTQAAGCLDNYASEKAARFIRTCDAFNIPIVEFVDTPGFLPELEQEQDGMVRRGAKLLFAYAEATVGKITVITRKALGEAYCAMGSKDLGADLVFAWPTAQIAVLDAENAAQEIYGKKGETTPEDMAKYEQEYEEKFINPYSAAELGLVDTVIPPAQTRGNIIEGLRLLDRKVVYLPPKKHGNIPL